MPLMAPDIVLQGAEPVLRLRSDKIGFATPEKNWLLALSSSLRPCLSRSNDLTPFLKNNSLLEAFDSIVEGRTPFSWQLWRWVNFIRWTELVLA